MAKQYEHQDRPAGSEVLESLLDRQPWDLLRPRLEDAPADSGNAILQLRAYMSELVRWNRGVSNLVSRNDEGRFVQRHVDESFAAVKAMVRSGASAWIDLGSGGGIPAVPLLLAGIGESWTLVESRRMKTLFLKRLVQELVLGNMRVVCARMEAMVEAGDHRGAFDGFTSRATLRLGPTLELAAHLVRPGGAAFLWKGARLEEELLKGREWREFWEEADRHEVSNSPTVVIQFVRKNDD